MLYEVRVEVSGSDYEYYSRFGKRICHSIVKMFHFEKNKPEQAIESGQKYGRVISCRKANRDRILGNAECTKLEPQPNLYEMGNPYQTAIHMDDMIWKKRNLRRANLPLDKPLE